jgi:hypothetical protein
MLQAASQYWRVRKGATMKAVASLVLVLLAMAAAHPVLAQRSEAECKQKHLIDTKPEDWKAFNECLTQIAQCRDCGAEKRVPAEAKVKAHDK